MTGSYANRAFHIERSARLVDRINQTVLDVGNNAQAEQQPKPHSEPGHTESQSMAICFIGFANGIVMKLCPRARDELHG